VKGVKINRLGLKRIAAGLDGSIMILAKGEGGEGDDRDVARGLVGT
jgi:hypothetical protein